MLIYWLKSNPQYDNTKIDIFGHEAWNYPGLIFSLNSPLTSMFSKGASLGRERGAEDQIFRR